LDAKSRAVEEVQTQLDQLLASSETTLAELASARSEIEKLEEAKQSLRAEADTLHGTIQKHEAAGHDRENRLQGLHQEVGSYCNYLPFFFYIFSLLLKLEAAKTTAAKKDSLIKEHQDQVAALESQLTSTTQQLHEHEAASQLAATMAAEAVAVEHAALLKVQTDFGTIKTELETSNASLSQALGDIQVKLAKLKGTEAEVKALSDQVAELNAEREKTASRISELEVEVLESQESQEAAEDRHTQSLARLKSLEEQLAQAVKATEAAELEAKAREEQHHAEAAEARKAYEAAVEATAEHHAKAISDIEALKEELNLAKAANEQAKLDAQAAAESHSRKLSEAESLYVSKKSEFSKEIQRITDDLEVRPFHFFKNDAKCDFRAKRRDIPKRLTM
jgi:chromosome segregation ATPase